MTELGFLLDLLLTHKLPKATREAVTARIREVEAQLGPRPAAPAAAPQPRSPHAQAPSTLAALARHPDLLAKLVDGGGTPSEPVPEPEPVAVVAQTPATVAALASRNQAIAASMSGKVDRASGRPRKF